MLRGLLLSLALIARGACAITTPMNLTQNFTPSSRNQSHAALLARVPNGIKSFVFINNATELELEYYRDGVGADDLHYVWSVTKSFSSYLVGLLIDEGLLASVDVEIGDLFPSDALWDGVSSASTKKRVTVEDLLTMTSGYWELVHGNAQTLRGALEIDYYGWAHGDFWYTNPSLLAYVINASAGCGPREYAVRTGAYAALGMAEADYSWEVNADGLETIGYGLSVRVRHMAKLGLLYAQRGLSGAAQVLSSDWVTQTREAHVETADDDWGQYGYLFWAKDDASAFSAIGAGGQYIVVYEDKGGAVLACTSDSDQASKALIEMVNEYFWGISADDPVTQPDDDDDDDDDDFVADTVSSAARRDPFGGIGKGSGALFFGCFVPVFLLWHR